MTTPSRHQILAGYLIDGHGGPVKKGQLITIESGTIVAIGDAADTGRGAGPPLTDLSHCVVLPGLVDSHVHLCMSGTTDPESREKQVGASYEDLIPIIAEHLRHQFSHGVLAVRDGGDPGAYVRRYVEEHHNLSLVPVTVLSPGRALHRSGRYGALIGEGVGENQSPLEFYRRHPPPARLIKVVNSGLNSLTSYGLRTDPQFSPAQLSDLIAEAHRDDVRVMVHANGEIPVRIAIEAGCDSIEHGFFMGRKNLQLMADRGIYWVPTVYTMKACALNAGNYRSTMDKKVVERNLSQQLQQLALARELGVKVALGTDSGSIGVLHGESLVEEMKLFMQAGFSLSETICSATRHGAQLLDLEELGALEVGKPAHFLVTRGTPAQLPRKLTYLEKIYLNGMPSDVYRRDPDYTTLRKFEGVAFSGKVKY